MMDVKLTALPEQPAASVDFCGMADAVRARAFHRTVPGYAPTPLVRLKGLAEKMGVAELCVKDESKRFGLNAFKVLGGSFCMSNLAWERLGLTGAPDFTVLTSPEVRDGLNGLTFVTATDGNHGRGVAWTAHMLGQRSVVYLPRGSAEERVRNIAQFATQATVTNLLYDDTVRLARQMAEKNGWLLVQDTAWPGYEAVPRLIMQGYTTMALEALEQLKGQRPTHIFLQCGVGSMAAAVAAFFCDCQPEEQPTVIVVEPHDADCMYQTALMNDGQLHATRGQLRSMMAGLCCGEPSSEAWRLLKQYARLYAAIPDDLAALGMRVLASPCEDAPRIISGESGASGFGLAVGLLMLPELAEQRQSIGLNADSRILCFSTEGATDLANWERVVWQGRNSL